MWRVKSPGTRQIFKDRTNMANSKIMFTVFFFGFRGIIHKGRFTWSQTVNEGFQENIINRFLKRILQVRPVLYISENGFCFITKLKRYILLLPNFEAWKSIKTVYPPPYSPNLPSTVSVLFQRLKLALKMWQKKINISPEENFPHIFQKHYKRFNVSNEKHGYYVENNKINKSPFFKSDFFFFFIASNQNIFEPTV